MQEHLKKTMNELIDNSVITRIHRKLKNLEKEEYRFVETFLSKYPELNDDVAIWLNSKEHETPHEKQGRWDDKIREIDSWLGREKRIDVHYMYTRTLELSKYYKSKKPLFQERPVGSISKNDVSSMIIRLEKLWKHLCLRIYPELDANFSYETYRKEEELQSHKGVINWHKTIINSASSAGVPLEFVCYTPERRYDTPENLLLMVSLNWLRKDAKTLLEYSGFPKLLAKQKNLVQKVFNVTNSIIETTTLQDIREKSNRISKRMFDDMVVNNLIKKVTERIKNGYIQDYNYLELKKWVITYMYFNVEKLQGVPHGVRLDTEQGLSKMYEYWILYEFVAYLENEKKISCLKTKREKISFNIFKDRKSIKLIFDMELKTKQLTTKTKMTPDYGIETLTILPNGNIEIPFIMDAKLYLESEHANASNKMNRYLDEMIEKDGTTKGILFFPISKWDPEIAAKVTATENFKEETLGKKTILSCVICPSKEREKIKAMYENFDKIYEEYLKPHLE